MAKTLESVARRLHSPVSMRRYSVSSKTSWKTVKRLGGCQEMVNGLFLYSPHLEGGHGLDIRYVRNSGFGREAGRDAGERLRWRLEGNA